MTHWGWCARGCAVPNLVQILHVCLRSSQILSPTHGDPRAALRRAQAALSALDALLAGGEAEGGATVAWAAAQAARFPQSVQGTLRPALARALQQAAPAKAIARQLAFMAPHSSEDSHWLAATVGGCSAE